MSISWGAMSASADTHPLAGPLRLADHGLLAGLAAFAVYHVALAVVMAAAPHAFYASLGPFGPYNSHYIRDTATFEAALAAGLAVAVVRPSWRVAVLAVTTLQFALHTINHLMDADTAHPAWTGWFDFASLLLATALLLTLLARARAVSSDPAERSTA